MNIKTKVLTVGVFDFFHLGHLNALKNAKNAGDYLIVAVHDDKLNSKGVDFLYTLEERISFIKHLNFVDEVISYERVDLLVEKINFDIFAHGPDQNHQYFKQAFEWCRKNNKKTYMTDRTEGISSTKLREILKNKDI